MTGITDRDQEMFKLTCRMELKMVAKQLGVSYNTLKSRYAWIRNRRVEWQRNINILNNADKMCGKLKKLLTKGNLKK